MANLLACIYFCAILIVVPISIHCFPSNSTQFSEEEGNFYYGNNFDEEGGIEEGRQKRIVISGLGATIAWSVLFTPLATMTVSKNFDLIDIMKRCSERKKAHYESKHPLAAFWESIACKETEAEAREKIVLIEIVKLAFQNLTPEARDLIAVEYEIFEQKMAKLRGDKDQQERLEWNVPGHRGKKFLCFLREFVNFDESNINDEGWENSTEKDHQFWRHCEESINKRRQMSWKGKTARSVQRWFERRKSTFECALRKIGKGFIWMGKLIMKWSGALENEIENEEKEKIEGECSKWKSILVDLKELAVKEGLEWPKHYQIDDGPLIEENLLMTAEEFFKKMRVQFEASRDEKKSSHSEENEIFEKIHKKNEKIVGEHGREKRALGAFTTLFFGIGMQQGYRHFNLIQLIRDCTIRSINYKSARCYPPPIIQEEIKLIQKAKEIAFQLIPKSAVDEINQKLSFYVKEKLRRKNALIEVPLNLLEKNLDLTHSNLDRIKSVPIPIKSFKKLMPKIDSDGCNAMISVPSEQMRAAIEAKNTIPECANSLKKLADAIIQNAVVQIPLKTYMEWEKDLNLLTDEREIEFVKKRGKNMKINGKIIEERLKMGGTISNPKETLAPILKPGHFIDVDLKFFTDKNEKLDELELLHTPMKKLNELFKEKHEKVKIAIPINFLAERYKEPTLSVPFGLIQEWVNEDENVPIIINEQFINQMGTIRAIPVSTLWLSALLDDEEIVNVSGEHFIQDFEEIYYENKSIEQFPMIIELQRNFKNIVKCEKICPERNFQGGQGSFKPIEQEHRKLNFNLDDLEIIDCLPLKMQNIKHYINEKHTKPRCPKNIFVTLKWLKKQKEKWEKELKNEGKQQFIVPILWKFFDKKLKTKNAKEIDGKFPQNFEFSVPLEFLAETMKTTQKIPVPSKMLSDAGLELPWKYALHLDCNAEYKFYDEETLNRCKIYHQKIQAIEEQKEIGQQKESELTMDKQIHSEKYKID